MIINPLLGISYLSIYSFLTKLQQFLWGYVFILNINTNLIDFKYISRKYKARKMVSFYNIKFHSNKILITINLTLNYENCR